RLESRERWGDMVTILRCNHHCIGHFRLFEHAFPGGIGVLRRDVVRGDKTGAAFGDRFSNSDIFGLVRVFQSVAAKNMRAPVARANRNKFQWWHLLHPGSGLSTNLTPTPS